MVGEAALLHQSNPGIAVPSISYATANANPVITVADAYSESPTMNHKAKYNPGKAEPRYNLERQSLLLPDGINRQRQDSEYLNYQNYREDNE